MVMLAFALAVVITFIVWIRRPEQRMMIRLNSELKISAAYAKPGEAMDMTVTVTNEKSTGVPLLRVDVDLPEELVFAGEERDLPRHRSQMCSIGPHQTLTFHYRVIADREGIAVVESPELVVYGLIGSIVDNNAAERGRVAARIRVRVPQEDA